MFNSRVESRLTVPMLMAVCVLYGASVGGGRWLDDTPTVYTYGYRYMYECVTECVSLKCIEQAVGSV